MKTKKEKQTWLKKHWLQQRNVDIYTTLNIGSATLSRWASEMGLPHKQSGKSIYTTNKVTTAEKIALDKEKKSKVTKEHELQKKYDASIKEISELQKLVGIKEHVGHFKPVKIELKKASNDGEAVAFALASDWHAEQTVDPRKILYKNQYNLKIAEARAKQFFTNTLKLLKKEQQDVRIETLVLWLGGDFITGNIHTENLKICSLGPSQAISFVRDLIVSGIQFLLDNSTVNLVIPYNHGNHARITEKVWKSSEEDNSLENILYEFIEKWFEDEPRITMVAPEGTVATVEVYGLKIGFVHGHHGFRYLDGVGGLYIPARKYIMRKFRKANYYLICMGHHHQYLQDTMFLCNGSMIGYDQYADSCGFDFDVPKQTFFLIDAKRKCRTVTTPILFTI